MDAQTSQDDTEYINTLKIISEHYRKQLLDEWLEQSENWIEGVAKYSVYRLRRGRRNIQSDAWEDMRSEMILQAYDAVHRWDAQRTPLDIYLRGTLYNYAMRSDVVKRNELQSFQRASDGFHDVHNEAYANESYYSEIAVSYTENNEKTSLERAHGVFDLLDGLHDHEKLIVCMHYQMGIELKMIDTMIGAGHSTTFHRLQQILERIREKRETHAFTK